MCVFRTSAFFSLPAAGLSECPRLQSTQRTRPNTTVRVWTLVEVRGACSGGAKSQKMTSNLEEAFRSSRAIQAHANPRTRLNNVRRATHVVQNSADGSNWLPAHLVLALERSCSYSRIPRAHALVVVLECSPARACS